MKREGYEMNKRKTVFDAIKGYAIFCVVLGHVSGLFGTQVQDLFSKVLTSFNMPLFAYVGGLLFNISNKDNMTFGKYSIKKIKRLVLPAIFWMGVVKVIKVLFKISTAYRLDLWYIWSIFIVYEVVGVVFLCFPITTFKKKYCLAIFLNLLIWMIPRQIYYAGFLLPFFLLGILFQYLSVEKLYDAMRRLSMWKKTGVFCILLVIYVLLLKNFKVNMYIYFGGISLYGGNNTIPYQLYINFFRIILAMIPIYIICYLLYWLDGLSLVYCSKIYKQICTWGKESLNIYIIHMIMIEILRVIMEWLEWNGDVNKNPIMVIAIFIISIAMIMFIIYLKRFFFQIPVVNNIVTNRNDFSKEG